MEYVYLLQATEEQYQKMMKFLDVVIKKDGFDAIQDVVDVYNVLVSGRRIPLSVEEQSLRKAEEAQPTPDILLPQETPPATVTE